MTDEQAGGDAAGAGPLKRRATDVPDAKARRLLLIGAFGSDLGAAQRRVVRRRAAWRAVLLAIVAGAGLTALHQWGRIQEGEMATRDWWRVAANFLVPLLVAIVAGLRGASSRARGGRRTTDH